MLFFISHSAILSAGIIPFSPPPFHFPFFCPLSQPPPHSSSNVLNLIVPFSRFNERTISSSAGWLLSRVVGLFFPPLSPLQDSSSRPLLTVFVWRGSMSVWFGENLLCTHPPTSSNTKRTHGTMPGRRQHFILLWLLSWNCFLLFFFVFFVFCNVLYAIKRNQKQTFVAHDGFLLKMSLDRILILLIR